MKKLFLIKYGEIAIKGNNRYRFENALVKNIKNAISPLGNFKIRKIQGRIIVTPKNEEYDYNQVLSKLQKIFGIVKIAPGIYFENNDFDFIKETALEHLKEMHGDKKYTFKVITRRADKDYPKKSMEISSDVGAYVLDNMENLTVDVHNPDVELRIEIRDKVYVYAREFKGSGGMPVGTNGKASLLLSGGIDSPVAGWMIAKRGVEIEGIYFHSHPYTSDRAKEKVKDLAKKLSEYTGSFKLHIVHFTDIQLAMRKACPEEELTIIMRRIMYDIAEKISTETKSQALITGESIGQVASQTMANLVVTNEAVKKPVFRPLIGFDKVDIIDLAKKIDTYETSILPYEDCCTIFVAKHPETRGKTKVIKESQAKIEKIDEMIEKVIENREILTI